MVKSEQAYDTYDSYYLDVSTNENGQLVPHFFSLAINIKKLTTSTFLSKICSSTQTCPTPAPASPELAYQFTFQRRDVTAGLVGVAGDGKSCNHEKMGQDAQGHILYQDITTAN